MSLQNFAKSLKEKAFPLEFPGHWIGGEWLAAPKALVIKESFNPSRDEKLIEVRLDRSIAIKAVDLGAQGERIVGSIEFDEKIELLKRLRQVLADYEEHIILVMTLEGGKPRWDAQADFAASLVFLDNMIGQSSALESTILGQAKFGFRSREYQLNPIGLTISFLPFSTPFSSFVHDVAVCLLAGCPLIIMSSGHAAVSALLFANLMEAVHLPPQFLSIVFGNFTFYRQMAQDRRVQAVLYNGSREHCDTLRKESQAQIQRELLLQSGGKNALIVDRDADLDHAVRCIILGIAKGAGQLCSSTSRVFIHDTCMKELSEKLVHAVKTMTIGPTDGKDDPQMGPLYSTRAIDKFLRFQTMAKREAKKTLLWGRTYEATTNGYFVMPGVHVIDEFDPTSAYQSNVIMAPDLALFEYKNLDEAIVKVNSTDAPHVVSFIGDPQTIKTKRRDLLAPNVFINLPTVELEPLGPLAGRNQGGNYRANGLGVVGLLTYPQALAEGSRLQAKP